MKCPIKSKAKVIKNIRMLESDVSNDIYDKTWMITYIYFTLIKVDAEGSLYTLFFTFVLCVESGIWSVWVIDYGCADNCNYWILKEHDILKYIEKYAQEN